jgi:hypothetical protein
MLFVDTVMKLLPEAIKTAPLTEVALYALIAFIALFCLFQSLGGGLFGLLPRAPAAIRAVVFVPMLLSAALLLFCAAILVQPDASACSRETLSSWHACLAAG